MHMPEIYECSESIAIEKMLKVCENDALKDLTAKQKAYNALMISRCEKALNAIKAGSRPYAAYQYVITGFEHFI